MERVIFTKRSDFRVRSKEMMLLFLFSLLFTSKNLGQVNVLEQVLKVYGKYQVSADACGTVSLGGCNITINKPAGATVYKVYAYAGAHSNKDPGVNPGKLSGIDLNLPKIAYSEPNSSFRYTTRYGDVTNDFTSLLNSAAPGLVNLLSLEKNTTSIDGVGVIVVWENPALTSNNGVSVSLGNIQTNLGIPVKLETAPIDVSNPAFKACLGLGIAYSFSPNDPQQISTVLINVNKKVLTTRAGGFDDGEPLNGGLITLGGEGDSKSLATEDELYDLAPCIQNGETAITVATSSLRNDEFLQAMYFQAESVESPTCNPAVGANISICSGGTIVLTASGGTSYEWTGPNGFNSTLQNPTIPNALPSMNGTYTVTINGCGAPVKKTIVVSILNASSSAGTIFCNGGTTTVTVDATGGTAPYSGIGNFTVSTGSYSFTVTDAKGCKSTTSGFISEPEPLMATSLAGTIACGGGSTTVIVSASDGTPPYSGTGAFIVGAGSFSFKVTDANGCTSTTTGFIPPPSMPYGGVLTPAQSTGNGPTTVNLSVRGVVGTIKQWEKQENCSGPWESIGFENMTAITVTTTDLLNCSTCYRVNVTEGSCPASVYSTVATIKVNQYAVGGKVTLQSNQSAASAALCPTDMAVLIPQNFVGKVAKWQYSYGTSPIWYDLPDSEGDEALFVNGSSISKTVYYRVVICSISDICLGQASVAYSSAFKVNKSTICSFPINNSPIINMGNAQQLLKPTAYPNPASNLVTLEIESYSNVTESETWQEGVAQIDIMDLTGRVVQRTQQTIVEGLNTFTLDIHSLSNGLYLVRIKDSSNHEAVVKVSKL